MLGSFGLNRVGTRRILTCPYCDRSQSIVPRPVAFLIGCRDLHRAFRVIEGPAVQAAVRADEGEIIPIWRPDRALGERAVRH